MTERRKTLVVLLAAFLLPCAVMLVVFAALGMAPFGPSSILTTDMSDQYVEFFSGMKNGDFLYSWSAGLGANYTGLIAYYLASPLSLLLLPVPNLYMPIGVLFLTVLKIGLSGLTMALLLTYKGGGARLPVLPFALGYALSAYNVAYSMGIMWLDGVFWLPLIVLGFERVLAGGKLRLLILSLALCFFSNYYIGYMVALFIVLYALARCFEEKLPLKKSAGVLGRLAGSGLAAAGLSAFLLLPGVLALLAGKLAGSGEEYGYRRVFPLNQLFRKLLPGQFDSLMDGAPFIYIGLALLALAVLFFLLPRIPWRAKIATAALGGVLLLSMWLIPLNKIWHGFQKPVWWPNRFSFILCFVMVLAAWRAWNAIKLSRRAWVAVLLLVVLLADLGYNAVTILRGVEDRFYYASYASWTEQQATMAPLVEVLNEDTDGFYRADASFRRSHNEPVGFGYRGITHYSSVYNGALNSFLLSMGFEQAHFWSSYYGATPATDSLLVVRYAMSREAYPSFYSEAAQSEGATLYQNPYALPVAVATAGMQAPEGENPFERQNAWLRALTGVEADAFTPLEVTFLEAPEGEFEITLQSDGRPLYLYPGRGWLAGTIYLNGEELFDYHEEGTGRVHYLGTFPAGETVTLWMLPIGWGEPALYTLDEAVLQNAAVTTQGMEVSAVHKNGLEGTVTAAQDCGLYTTIPYDKGWRVSVDGQRVTPESYWDVFLVIPLEAGTHTVKMWYIPPGFIPGVIITAGTAALLLGLWLLRKRRAKGQSARQ